MPPVVRSITAPPLPLRPSSQRNSSWNTKSMPPRNSPTAIDSASTTTVRLTVSRCVGQTTLRSSERTSWMKSSGAMRRPRPPGESGRLPRPAPGAVPAPPRRDCSRFMPPRAVLGCGFLVWATRRPFAGAGEPRRCAVSRALGSRLAGLGLLSSAHRPAGLVRLGRRRPWHGQRRTADSTTHVGPLPTTNAPGARSWKSVPLPDPQAGGARVRYS